MTEIEMIQVIDSLTGRLQETLGIIKELSDLTRAVNANVRFLANAVGVELPTP